MLRTTYNQLSLQRHGVLPALQGPLSKMDEQVDERQQEDDWGRASEGITGGRKKTSH